MRSLTSKIVPVVVLLALVVGWQVHKRMPPYEQGTHTDVVEAQAARGGGGPRIGNCPVFPADNVWNTPVDKLPRDQRTEAYTDSIGPLHTLHPDFGENLAYGIPFTEIPAGTRAAHVKFEYADESDQGSYPIPADAPIEGGAKSEGDRHVLLIDPRRCLLYELWLSKQLPDGSWTAGSGARFDLTSNALRADGKTSADAAGLAILPGLVRFDEVAAGEINHALRFTIPHTQKAYVWPARHQSSSSADFKLPPLGERFRLRADFDLTKFSKSNQVILRAMQKYGMILADNGSSMYLSGVSDKRWDDSDLHKLNGIKVEDFEAVDESGWQMLPDSARVDPVAFARK